MAGEIQSFVDRADEDSVQEAAALTLGQRLGLMLGVLFFLGSLVVLVWNEGCFIEAMRQLHAIPEVKHVELRGALATDDMLSDDVFYVSVTAVRMARLVEMYQWQEEGGKVVSYTQGWSQEPVDSAAFSHPEGHTNPAMPFRNDLFSAANVKLDGVVLSPRIIEQLEDFTDYPLTPDHFTKINPELTGFKLVGGQYYKGNNPAKPAVGDIRVHFRVVAPGQVATVSGMEQGGRLDVEQAVAHKPQQDGTALTWALRIGGWLAMFVGVLLVLFSLQVYGTKWPLLATMATFGLRLIAMVAATAITLVTIAVIWFSHSPQTAIMLLSVASMVIIASTFMRREKKPEAIPVAVKYFKVPRPAPVQAPAAATPDSPAETQ